MQKKTPPKILDSKNFFRSFLNIILLLSFNLNQSALARLDFSDLKGLRENIPIAPGYEHYDPIVPFNLVNQPTLINIYNYPRRMHDKIVDPVEDFVQNLFNAPAGTDNPLLFQVSPLASKFGRFLGPSTVGLILSELSQNSPAATDLSELKAKLKSKIQSDPDYQSRLKEAQSAYEQVNTDLKSCNTDLAKTKKLIPIYQQEINKVTSLYRKLDRLNKDKSEKCKIPTDDLEKIETVINSIDHLILHSRLGDSAHPEPSSNIRLEKMVFLEIHSLLLKVKKNAVNYLELLIQQKDRKDAECRALIKKKKIHEFVPDYLDQFLDRLVKSWTQESTPHSYYPMHMTEQVLLALAMMNTEEHNKRQFIQIYEHLPHVLDSKKLQNGKIEEGSWLDQRFQAGDFFKIIDTLEFLNTDQQADYLLKHPDQLAFISYGKSFYKRDYLPHLGTQSIRVTHTNKTKPVSFLDCMESSVLNFLAIIMKDPNGNFNQNGLKQNLKKNGFSLNPEFKQFISNHKDLSTLTSRSAHENWAQLLTSVNEIEYANYDYELEPVFDNFFKILDHLVFQTDIPSEKLSVLKTSSEKMDKICSLLSRAGFEVTWDVEGGKKSDLNRLVKPSEKLVLVFKINGRLAFAWNMLNYVHSEIQILDNPSAITNSQDTALALAQKIGTDFKAHSIQSQALSWLARPADLYQIRSQLNLIEGTPASLHFRYSLPVIETSEKISTFQELLKSNEPSSVGAAMRIFSSVPGGDPYIQIQFLKAVYQLNRENEFEDVIQESLQSFKTSASQRLALELALSTGSLPLIEKMIRLQFPVTLDTVNSLLKAQNVTPDIAQLIFAQLKADQNWDSFPKQILMNSIYNRPTFDSVFPLLFEKSPEMFLGGDGVQSIMSALINYGQESKAYKIIQILPLDKILLDGQPVGFLYFAAKNLENSQLIEEVIDRLKLQPRLFEKYREVLKAQIYTPLDGALTRGNKINYHTLELLVRTFPELVTQLNRDQRKSQEYLNKISDSSVRQKVLDILTGKAH